MTLKLKSLIYKYTGLYLADKEELEYITSRECWKKLMKIAKNKKNDMSLENIQGLLIGMWQAEHGFARPSSRYWLKKPRLFWNFINWFIVLFITIKWDLERLFRRK